MVIEVEKCQAMDADEKECYHALQRVGRSLCPEEFRGFVVLMDAHFEKEEKFLREAHWVGYEECEACILEHGRIMGQLREFAGLEAEALTGDVVRSVQQTFFRHLIVDKACNDRAVAALEEVRSFPLRLSLLPFPLKFRS